MPWTYTTLPSGSIVPDAPSFFSVAVVLDNQQGYPLGPITATINGILAYQLDNPTIGINQVGPFPLGSTVVITIINAADPDCNIVFPPVVTDCPSPTVEVGPFIDCNYQPEGPDGPTVPIWGQILTVTPDAQYPIGGVRYFTPLIPEGADAVVIAPNVYGCGPLEVAEDPGPMTIQIINEANENCNVELGPYTPEECPPENPCTDCLEISEEAICFTVVEGALLQVETSTGYITIVDPGGAVSIEVADGNPIPLAAGTNCMYPSLDDGTPSGDYGTTDVSGIVINSLVSATGSFTGFLGDVFFTVQPLPLFVVPDIGDAYQFVIHGDPSSDGPTVVDATALNLNNIAQLSFLNANLTEVSLSGTFEYFVGGSGVNIEFSDCTLLSSASQDSVANRLNPSKPGTVTIGGTPPTDTVTAASQANRQACYDNGWFLPTEWLWDLVL